MAASNTMQEKTHTWIELDAAAYRHNVQIFRHKFTSATRICLVVKANAYGHGAKQMVRLATSMGLADWFAVHSSSEAREVWSLAPDHPILILGYVPQKALPDVLHPRIRLTVWNNESVHAISSLGQAHGYEVPVHLKVETGTNRHGIPPRDVVEFARLIRGLPGIFLEGVSTHYANIEDTTDYSYANRQTDVLFETCRELKNNGFTEIIVHAACSAAALLFPETHLDLVRLGIASYGIWPSRETLVSASGMPDFTPLKPVLTWKARLSQIKFVEEGEYIGYGCTFRTTRRTCLGIVPIGYAEGYPRGLSNVGHVLIRGRRAPVRGRVCMNILMVDLTDIPDAKVEEPVVLIGRENDDRITAADIASMCGTIPYEILSRLSPTIPRYVLPQDSERIS